MASFSDLPFITFTYRQINASDSSYDARMTDQ